MKQSSLLKVVITDIEYIILVFAYLYFCTLLTELL